MRPASIEAREERNGTVTKFVVENVNFLDDVIHDVRSLAFLANLLVFDDVTR